MKESKNSALNIFITMNKNKKIWISILLLAAFCSLLASFNLGNFFSTVIDFLSLIRGKSLNDWQDKLQVAFLDFSFAATLSVLIWSFYDRISFSERQNKILKFFLFVLFATVTFITVLLHEPYADEVHAWFLAKSHSIPSLWHEMRYEGHFILWYLILMPFAKLGFPIITLNIISWLIFCVATALFLWKSPFLNWAKIAVLCSTAFLFWYPVVSRCYVLIPLLLFLLSILYEKRNEHPITFAMLIALLSNTHAYIEGFVAIVTAVFFVNDMIFSWKRYSKKERTLHIVSLCIILTGVLVAFLQVMPAFFVPDKNVDAKINFSANALIGFFVGSRVFIGLIPFFCVAFIITLKYIFQNDKTQFLILACTIFYMLAFALFIYGARVPNRGLLWFFALIFALWNMKTTVLEKSILLAVTALFINRPVSSTIQDWTSDFSAEKSITEYIQKNYAQGTPVFVQTQHDNVSIALTLPNSIPRYHLESLKPLTVYSFSKTYNPHTEKNISGYVSDIANSGDFDFPLILVFANRIPHAELSQYEYEETEFPCIAGKDFWIYELGKAKSDSDENK